MEKAVAYGNVLTDFDKCYLFMECLNSEIFENQKREFKSLAHENSYPKVYEELKARMRSELTSISRTVKGAACVLRTAGAKAKLGNREPSESSFFSKTQESVQKEKQESSKKKPKKRKHVDITQDIKEEVTSEQHDLSHVICYACEKPGHTIKSCPKVNANRKKHRSKVKSEQVKKCCMGTVNTALVGDIYSDSEMDVKSAGLLVEKSYVSNIKPNEVDFVLDYGTESGVAGSEDREILAQIRGENVLLEGVTGNAISREAGVSMFGNTRILDTHYGAILVNYPAWVRHMIDNVMTKYGDKFVDAVKSMRRINIQSARAVAEQFPE